MKRTEEGNQFVSKTKKDEDKTWTPLLDQDHGPSIFTYPQKLENK